MANNVVNYNVFAERKEEIQRLERATRRKEIVKRVYLVLGILLAIFVGWVLGNSKCNYYKFTTISEDEDNSGVSYQAFLKGYIKYSSSGIEYQNRFGHSVWNESVSFQHPYLTTSDNYALLINRGSNKAMLFDAEGKVSEETLRYPVIQATVSNQGITEVIMEADNTNYIFVYDVDGNKISEIKSSIAATGYPVTAAISPDGTKLVVSYYTINGMGGKTTVTFYDFSTQIQNNSLSFTGSYSYDDCLIPKLKFTDDHTLMAIADNALRYYNTGDRPKEVKCIELDEDIRSVFGNKKYTGIIYDHTSGSDEEGDYRLCIYNKSGREKVNVTLDMNYDNIVMWKNQIVAYRDNYCTILNLSGKILYQGKLDGDTIETIIPATGIRSYYVIFSDKLEKMRLQFWE